MSPTTVMLTTWATTRCLTRGGRRVYPRSASFPICPKATWTSGRRESASSFFLYFTTALKLLWDRHTFIHRYQIHPVYRMAQSLENVSLCAVDGLQGGAMAISAHRDGEKSLVPAFKNETLPMQPQTRNPANIDPQGDVKPCRLALCE